MTARRATEFAGRIENYSWRRALKQREEVDMRVVDLISTTAEGKFGPAQRMAEAIVEIHRKQGGCLPQDLLGKNFTNDDIDRHWGMAKALAYVELYVLDS